MMTNSNNIKEGHVCSHTPAMYKLKSLTAYGIFQCLYVDDRAFPFEMQEDMIKGLNLIYHHFARFGLEMHIGRGGKESKTKCVFFPSPQFIATKEIQLTITATTTACLQLIEVANTENATTSSLVENAKNADFVAPKNFHIRYNFWARPCTNIQVHQQRTNE